MTETTARETTARTRWGRLKGRRASTSAMAVALPAGLVLGVALAAAAFAAGITGPVPLLGAAVFALCFAVPSVMLVWVLVVDRSTLEGVSDRSEESIEARWHVEASAGAQLDVVVGASLAAVLLTVVPSATGVDARLVLVGVIGLSFVSFALRYQVLRRRS